MVSSLYKKLKPILSKQVGRNIGQMLLVLSSSTVEICENSVLANLCTNHRAHYNNKMAFKLIVVKNREMETSSTTIPVPI